MGKAISMMMRPAKKFNIEQRAHNVISREKPTPAPLYESTKKQLEIARTMNPSFMEDHYKKDTELDERLKNIYVQSHDHETTTKIEANPDRPLPTLTRSAQAFEYGFWEPTKASEGRCTLRTAMIFMADHQEDPVKNSTEEIAAKYKLEPKDVANVLEYFRVFKVIVPDKNSSLAYVDRSHIEAGQNKN